MLPVNPPDLFQLVRLGVALDGLDGRALRGQLHELDEHRRTLLHEAISRQRVDAALFLLNHGINVQQADDQGATALHFAALYRQADVTARILALRGNPNALDAHGDTPLGTTVFNAWGDYRVVQLLLDAGADPNSKNNYGKSPVDFAQQINDHTLLDILSAT